MYRVSPKSLLLSVCLSTVIAASALAQDDERHLTVNIGGGFTAITGDEAGKLDHGGNFQAGAGFRANRYFSIVGNFMFNQLGITRSALDALEQPDGNGRVYSFTVDPTLRFPLMRGASIYVLGGGGWLRRTVEFTQPSLAEITVFDPWWGYFGPALVPVNVVLGSVSSDAGAVDVGAGVNIPFPRTRVKVYAEVRYIHGFTSRTSTAIVPITFGLRW